MAKKPTDKQATPGVVIPDAPEPEWPVIGMTIAEAARSLRVSARTVQDMLAKGRLPGRMVGNKWRLSPKALDRFLDDFEDDDDLDAVEDDEESDDDEDSEM